MSRLLAADLFPGDTPGMTLSAAPRAAVVTAKPWASPWPSVRAVARSGPPRSRSPTAHPAAPALTARVEVSSCPRLTGKPQSAEDRALCLIKRITLVQERL